MISGQPAQDHAAYRTLLQSQHTGSPLPAKLEDGSGSIQPHSVPAPQQLSLSELNRRLEDSSGSSAQRSFAAPGASHVQPSVGLRQTWQETRSRLTVSSAQLSEAAEPSEPAPHSKALEQSQPAAVSLLSSGDLRSRGDQQGQQLLSSEAFPAQSLPNATPGLAAAGVLSDSVKTGSEEDCPVILEKLRVRNRSAQKRYRDRQKVRQLLHMAAYMLFPAPFLHDTAPHESSPQLPSRSMHWQPCSDVAQHLLELKAFSWIHFMSSTFA